MIAAIAGSGSLVTSQTASGNVAAPTMEPIEICFVQPTTTTKIKVSAARAQGVRHRNAPTKLATAFPPLNPRKTGNAIPPHPRQRRDAHPKPIAASHTTRDPYRREPFRDVQQQRSNTRRLPSCPQNVCRADVAAALPANV